MANQIATNGAPTRPGNTASYKPELRYSVPECSRDRNFPSESALRKHEANHNKTYICQVPKCKKTHFGNKGGLDRHNREVHGSQTHCCPFTSCKRHIRGFPRKYNLFEHQKRCHPSQSPNSAPPSILNRQESCESESSLDIATGGSGRLREKMENLCKMRAEIDTDIEALKRSLDLVGDDSA